LRSEEVQIMAKLLVTLAGLGLIVFINWYFFLAGRPKRDRSGRAKGRVSPQN